MNRDELERLVIVEQDVKHLGRDLQEVKSDLKEFRDDNDKRLDELKAMIHVISERPTFVGWLSNNKKWVTPIGVALFMRLVGLDIELVSKVSALFQ